MSENMKSSGIKWIKDIPNSWNTIKVKHLATDKNSLFLDGDWIESYDLNGGQGIEIDFDTYQAKLKELGFR